MNKPGNEVMVGDVLVAFDREVQVKSLRPYLGSLLDVVGEGSQIASFHATTMEMTLCAKDRYEIV
ncbi:hypothetical protein QZM48_04200 [Burkholderia orbicola]|uniref:hypothetical protein n=1 Tax=Burkholderia orbicola TaxID=2978683 RepID=UPI00264BF3D7|nr:hypothetical protein [Burkholderia orbicola]MDN7729208.1 hypothetical protein [Burkholderia orbicola]